MNLSTLEESLSKDTSARSGYIFSITSAFFTGCAIVIGKWNLESISALLMNSLIFSIASVIMSLILFPLRGPRNIFSLTRKGWLWTVLFTASSCAAIWAYWAGIQKMDPTLAALLNRSEVPVAIFLGIIFLKERFTFLESLGAIISIAGIIIMRMTLRFEYSTGFWLTLIGAFFFGLTEFFSKIAVKHVEPIALTYLRNLFVAIFYWVILMGIGPSFAGLHKVWLGVMALSLLAPIFSRMIYLLALQRLELSKVAIISQTQPVFVVLIAFSFLGQIPTFREIAGGLFLTAGCLIMVLSRINKSPSEPCRTGQN